MSLNKQGGSSLSLAGLPATARTLLSLASILLMSLACNGTKSGDARPVLVAGATGGGAAGAPAAVGMPTSGSTAGVTSAAGMMPSGGFGGQVGQVHGTAGTSAGAAGVASHVAAGAGGVAGSAGLTGSHSGDHCVVGYDADPADKTMVDGPAEYVKSGQVDLTVQPEVLTWLQEHEWEAAHFEWHNIRRCVGGMSTSKVNICSYRTMIPADQECRSDGDGYQFLVMHRHMIQSLKQLFPTHTEQFEGFAQFPQKAEDVPMQWRAGWRSFSAQDLANAKIADEISNPTNLSKFPSDGAFGRWLQCFAPTYSGLHGALHFKWVKPMNTDHGLGNQEKNIDNYMFWKLHGWIDNVWEKYRSAKGLAPDEPKLRDALTAQCREMDALAQIVNPDLEPDPGSNPLPTESGAFHQTVRPIFESETNKCSGCHGPTGAEAGMSLGGNISSAAIVTGLVNKQSLRGGQYKLVIPGDPDRSWLYLKASGQAATAQCTATAPAMCNPQVMPPESSGRATVSQTELASLRKWIQDGAVAPTSQ